MKKVTYQGVSTLEVLEGADNYNKWIASSILQYSRSPILEIGAGTGNITEHFLKKSSLSVTEFDKQLVLHLKRKFREKKSLKIFHLDIESDPKRKHINTFLTLFAVNVFEHIKDDKRAFLNAYKHLKKNGRLIVLVPAKKFAYTRLDKSLGHHRRYEKNELEEKLVSCGFVVEKIYYFNIVGLASWIIRDKIEKQHVQLSSSHIALFDKIVPILKYIESHIPIPIGISLIAVAKKHE